MAAVKKDSLLANVPSPRIIFVGGSNLSFGLNSQKIKDSLHLNPINTAIHAGIGLKYMLENTLQYTQKGDIIVLAPEYDHFYEDWNHSSNVLFRMVFDVKRMGIKLLNRKQIQNCIPYTGGYILSKVNVCEYINIDEDETYSVNSFNIFGDADAHWILKNRQFKPFGQTSFTKYNPDIMMQIKLIFNELQKKGCTPLISYPGFQESSFNNTKESITNVEKEFHANGFTVLGTPQRYMMPDSLMFDTPYHLNKTGVERRTALLIEDLKAYFAHDIDSLGLLK
jgi:hypothetical protein